MAKKKKSKSSKLKSQKSRKAWQMLLAGDDYKTIGDAVGYTSTAIKQFARKKFRDESEKLWAAEIKKGGKCEISLRDYDLHAHHLLEKSVWPHLSRDLMNGLSLNADYHEFNVEISPHTNLVANVEFLAWLRQYRSDKYLWYMEHKDDRKYIDIDFEAEYWKLKENRHERDKVIDSKMVL